VQQRAQQLDLLGREGRQQAPLAAAGAFAQLAVGLHALGGEGSSGWSAAFHLTRLLGVAPAAMLFNEMTTKIALGAVVTRAPAMTDFDRDPLACIATGDWVVVDADRGVVEIRKATRIA
jgi:hypothetical protein